MDDLHTRRARQRTRLRSLRTRRTTTPALPPPLPPPSPRIGPYPILRIGDEAADGDVTEGPPSETLVPILRIDGSGLRCACCQPGLRVLH